MNEYQTKLLAGGVGLASVAAVGIVSVRRDPPMGPPLQIVEQLSVTDRGKDFPPGVFFRTEPSLAEYFSNDGMPLFEVRDAGDFKYPVSRYANEYGWIPMGYTKKPSKPTLILYKTGKVVSRIPMRDFPAPKPVPLVPSAEAPVRLFQNESTIFAETVKPVRDDESWYVSLISTPSSSVVSGSDTITIGRNSPEPGQIRLLYPGVVSFARIEVSRHRTVRRTEDFRLEGLRLVKRQGETILLLPKPVTLQGSLGFQVVAKSQREPSRLSRIDHRNPTLPLELQRTKTMSAPGGYPSLEFVSPSPDSLNLNWLSFGAASRMAKSPPKGTPSSNPFTATIRLSIADDRISPSERYVVPVKPASREYVSRINRGKRRNGGRPVPIIIGRPPED